jgi:hypothetical protein
MLVFLLIAAQLSAPTNDQVRLMSVPSEAVPAPARSPQYTLNVGGAEIEVDLRLENTSLQPGDVLDWVRRATEAVNTYYARFPVRNARVSVLVSNENNRSIHGTTWGDVDGFQSVSRMRLGRAVSRADLESDWTMTHELVHLAISSLPDKNHWLEEGLATYVEPIARSQDGQLPATNVWQGMVAGMAQGQPRRGDHGLDETHTWGRTYWGGAMFCLVADVEIRRTTANRKGLQDALRAIVAAGATIDTESDLPRILRLGDKATGTTVLSDLYDKWKDSPVSVDLEDLWRELGVQVEPSGIGIDPGAPLAEIRNSITARPRAEIGHGGWIF